MGRAIIKIKDRYFEWSTIVDAPITYGLTLDELKQYIKDEYGNEGFRELDARLERIEKTGASWVSGMTMEETIECNRAGDDETELTADEIYDYYTPTPPLNSETGGI